MPSEAPWFSQAPWFVAAFIVSAVVAVLVRTALHEPYPPPAPLAQGAVAAPVPNDVASPARASPVKSAPVNTLCAICGMKVDPKLPTARYQGKVIGFGCGMCPPLFAAEPDKYGPLFLTNQVAK